MILFIVDGVESYKPKSYMSKPKGMGGKKPTRIRMLNPIQGEKQYGEKWKNGVVIYRKSQ